jgi:hypothetical protein
MPAIPLTKNKHALVDDETFLKIGNLNWCYNTNGYAMRMPPRNKKHRTPIYMHKEIMGISGKTQVDHINGDKLDNRLENLRICNTSQNHANTRLRIDNTSGFKGVVKHRNKWQAQIHEFGECIRLGVYKTKQEAATAYDKAAKELFGDFALTNKEMGLL